MSIIKSDPGALDFAKRSTGWVSVESHDGKCSESAWRLRNRTKEIRSQRKALASSSKRIQFHFNDKLTFYGRCRASLDELRNHFQEALGNKYIDENLYNCSCNRMKEIGFLLSRLMRNVKKARGDYENSRKLNRNSSRRVTSNAKH